VSQPLGGLVLLRRRRNCPLGFGRAAELILSTSVGQRYLDHAGGTGSSLIKYCLRRFPFMFLMKVIVDHKRGHENGFVEGSYRCTKRYYKEG
jgi:hypothetical protein